MSLTIKTGATRSISGGTDLAFSYDGVQRANGVNLIVAADTNLLTRRSAFFQASLPAPATKVGGYARLARCMVTYHVPFLAADGKLYDQTFKVSCNRHPEYTTEAAARGILGELLEATGTSSFHTNLVIRPKTTRNPSNAPRKICKTEIGPVKEKPIKASRSGGEQCVPCIYHGAGSSLQWELSECACRRTSMVPACAWRLR